MNIADAAPGPHRLCRKPLEPDRFKPYELRECGKSVDYGLKATDLGRSIITTQDMDFAKPEAGTPDTPQEQFLANFSRLCSDSDVGQHIVLAGGQDYDYHRSQIELVVMYHDYGALSVVFMSQDWLNRCLVNKPSQGRVVLNPNKRLIVVEKIEPEILFEILEHWWEE